MKLKISHTFTMIVLTTFAIPVFAAGPNDYRDPGRQPNTKPATQAPRKTYPTRTPGSASPSAGHASSSAKSNYNLKLDAGKILRGEGYLSAGLDIQFTENLVAGPIAGFLIKGTAGVKGYQFGASGTYYYNHPYYTSGIVIVSEVNYATLSVNTTPYYNAIGLMGGGGYQHWVTDPKWNGVNFTIAGGLQYSSLSYPAGSPLRVVSSLASLVGGTSSVTDSASSIDPVLMALIGYRF